MNKLLLTSVILSSLIVSCKAQLSNDTTLYLLLTDDKRISKIDHSTFSFLDREAEAVYYLDYYLYDGYPLTFESVDRKEADNVSKNQLDQYPVVTPQQLQNFIGKRYGKSRGENPQYYGGSFFDQLKHIYIVEQNAVGDSATITRVKLTVQIE